MENLELKQKKEFNRLVFWGGVAAIGTILTYFEAVFALPTAIAYWRLAVTFDENGKLENQKAQSNSRTRTRR
ncbi:MAG: hypothetical protein UY21_C0027G0005 [Microgenomates group bacterium GW2011_GWA1_48_10]|uniref:Uncharacterized protein n=1 Tax=Candidatus Gottesmanbacteria bacterium RIFCSPHIGHO2_01_FULL_47_48 TaxID=1798381 RepID=A0A1F6A6E8_9BACT|nr:MAG: hypothetical protein UY21_C0027G0005 [Microgenomates group bacterium GW2011_GWA1_48_10]OGG19877.1 MAG: hypothetical protein A2721_03190 [Candidatus Gottesmanbacteria bacterium RIFCSPHIGHO2_01_FULL_47_48]